jgi:hypothetical protein
MSTTAEHPACGTTPSTRLFEPAPAEARSVIENRTGARIGICFHDDSRCMVLPPFGSRVVRTGDICGLRLEAWAVRGLVQVRHVPRRHVRTWFPSLLSLGVWSIPVLGIAMLIRRQTLLWKAEAALWGVILVAGLVTWARQHYLRKHGSAQEQQAALEYREQLVGAAGRWMGMAMVLAIGVGLPGGLLWAQRAELMRAGIHVSQLCQLFLGIFASFVAVVSTLPALLFFLFQQHRQETARTTFFREVMRIDRSLQTVTDAEATYGLAVDEAYGKARQGMVFNLALVPVLISTLLMAFGWTAVLLPTLADVTDKALDFRSMELATLLEPRRTEFTFAFLGAYFFTLNMVFRRYVRADLGPKAYSHISVRIIVAVVLAWVAAAIPGIATDAAQPAAMLLVLAFFVGIVPETGLAMIHDVVRARWNPLGKLIPSLEEKDPLTRLEGITLYDRARLLEEGIENVENLAHHDLIELMLRTRIPTPRVVDLMDQAILYLHVRSAVDDDPEDALRTLRRIGIRTATDLLEAERCMPGELLHAFDDALGSQGGLPRLQMICISMADDEWIPQLMHWRDTRTRCDSVLELDDFLRQMRTGTHRAPHARVRPPRPAAPRGTGPSRNGTAEGHEASALPPAAPHGAGEPVAVSG